MAKSPLEDVTVRWMKRASQLKSAGIKDSAWTELARRDIQNVRRGGTPMADEEALVATLSAHAGKPIISDPSRKTGGLFDVLGNIPSDVADIVKGFPAGVAHFVTSLPHETSDLGKVLSGDQAAQDKYGLQKHDPWDIGAALRNVSKMPLIREALPIVHTAAGLTTSEGRKEIEKHPVGSFLDVLPALSVVGEVATVGKVAEKGSVTEALQRGNVVKAAYRATPGLPSVVHRFAEAHGLDQVFREKLVRNYNQLKRAARTKTAQWMEGNLKWWQEKSPEEQVRLSEMATHYNVHDPSLSPEDHAQVQQMRLVSDSLRGVGESEGQLVTFPLGDGKYATYARDEAPVRTLNKMVRASSKAYVTREKVGQLSEELAERQAMVEARAGKVRKFGEKPHEFHARPVGPISMEVVAEAARPITESFQHIGPSAFPEFADKITPSVARVVGRGLTQLSGDGGLFAKLQDALEGGKVREAQVKSTQIINLLKKPAFRGFDTARSIRNYVGDLREELIGMTSKERSHGYAARLVGTTEKKLRAAQSQHAAATESLRGASKDFEEALTANPPASMHPLLGDEIRQQAIESVKAKGLQKAQLETAIQEIKDTGSLNDLVSLVGKEFDPIIESTLRSWRDRMANGDNPVWLHHVTANRMEALLTPTILSDRVYRPGVWKQRVFNFSPGIMNVGAGFTDAARQIFSHEGTVEFVNRYLKPYFVKDKGELRREYMKSLQGEGLRPGESVRDLAEQKLNKEFAPFDPERYGVGRFFPITSEGYVLAKGVANGLETMMMDYDRFRGLPLYGAYDKVLNTWRFSVLTGPRHMVHIGIGGLMFMALREPQALLKLGQAYKLIKSDPLALNEIRTGLYGVDLDKMFHFAAGKTLGRMLNQAGEVLKAPAHAEEFITNVYRAAVALSKGSREEGIQAALKTFIDLDGMAPIERTIIKQVFPFYAFTKHLFRYALSYPVDHPVRAAILSRFAEQEIADWQSGLPHKYMQLFFLGEPDTKGNVTAVDYKNINPFRSFANDFTLAGFVSALNPIATAVGSAAGIDILSATPELYPELSYNPDTGSLQAKRTDTLAKIGEALVPPLGSIDHLVQFSDRLRRLKETSPDGYRRQLFSALNIPFAWGNVNVPYELARSERNRFKAAQMAVSQGVKTGQFGAAKRFNLVPFRGQIVKPQVVEQMIEELMAVMNQRGMAGTSPKAVMTPYRGRKR